MPRASIWIDCPQAVVHAASHAPASASSRPWRLEVCLPTVFLRHLDWSHPVAQTLIGRPTLESMCFEPRLISAVAVAGRCAGSRRRRNPGPSQACSSSMEYTCSGVLAPLKARSSSTGRGLSPSSKMTPPGKLSYSRITAVVPSLKRTLAPSLPGFRPVNSRLSTTNQRHQSLN